LKCAKLPFGKQIKLIKHDIRLVHYSNQPVK
jgi:hypothetical protein